MYTIQAPPGHPGQPAVLIACAFLDKPLTMDAPDPDLQAPILKAEDHTAHGTADILRYVASHGGALPSTKLYPLELQGSIDKWLQLAASCEAAALAWVEPFAAKADDAAREAAKSDVTTALEQLKVDLMAGNEFLAGDLLTRIKVIRTARLGDSLTLADVAVAAALTPLFQSVLGRQLQRHFAPVVDWLGRCQKLPQFEKALGAE
ncbi:hypothetical protein VOLCADRAFT_117679 [Volvox carteri f. nagariensis]|uniref:GST C-terminal domain-containing protein n=1 Tax=Volvox carteri f. nagariensis TaxID=3068 RepID=D8TWM4_VOLCA|nr:uncharacterized protein VOLCADRAFT_117679 [Volvox carteri f. nagariensis]EFJ48076.1 hypothetical protein VOLCADRAFT_117679 [Volvox carteri f. nagariensis]|eukprot:XP_002950761.1 hypothetical protein VOLCADRAFT_117679 [Volvox carteri f. nagariensis]